MLAPGYEPTTFPHEPSLRARTYFPRFQTKTRDSSNDVSLPQTKKHSCSNLSIISLSSEDKEKQNRYQRQNNKKGNETHSIQNIFFCFTCRRRRTFKVRMKTKMTQDKDMLEIQWQPQIMNPSLSEKNRASRC